MNTASAQSERLPNDRNPPTDPPARYPADPDLKAAVVEGPVANLQRCYRFIGARPGEYVELQALDVPLRPNGFKPNYFAHAASEDEFIRLCGLGEVLGLGAPAVYVILNQIDPAVVTRAPVGQWHQQAKGASTEDANIEARRVLYIDIDPERPKGTSSTDEQMNEAHAVGAAIADRLSTILGPDALLRGHSGNGAAVQVALDYLPCTPELTATIRDILTALSALYGSERIVIDQKVSDPKRLAPAFGTLKKKGAPNVPERPHRRSACICAATVRRIGLSELRKLRDELVASAPEVPKSKTQNTQQTPSSGDGPWKLANAIDPREVAAWLGILNGDVVTCPGCGETKGVDVIEHGLKCHHNRCNGKGRNGFRTNIDLVIEVRGVDAKTAYSLLAEQFGLEPLRSKASSPTNGATEDRELYERLVAEARSNGYQVGWIAHQYRKSVDHWPPREWKESTESRFASDEEWIIAAEARAHQAAEIEFERGDHVELAEKMISRIEANGPQAVFDDLALHRYDNESGLWRVVSNSEQSRIVQGFAGAAIPTAKGTKPLKIKSPDVSGSRQLAAHQRERLGFFADAPRRGIAFKNGFVVLDAHGKRTLTPHAPENRVRYGYDFPYEDSGAPAKWLKFLNGVFRDDDDRDQKIAFVQEFFGVALLGIATTYQRCVMALGEGENGKSKLADIMVAAFPKNSYCSIAPHTFGQTYSSEYTRAMLAGKLLNVCNELPDSDIVGTEQFKAIVTGEPIHARPIRNDPFSFRPIAAHYFAANRLPGTLDHSHGFWRRWVAIGFNRNFHGDAERDADIATKIISSELPAIVPWLLEGGARVIKQGGYTIPASHYALVREWRSHADQVALFVEEKCVKSLDDRPHEHVAHDWTPATTLYFEYKMWAVANGHRTLASNNFGERMAKLGRPSHRTSKGAFYPVRLLRPGEVTDWVAGLERSPSSTRPNNSGGYN